MHSNDRPINVALCVFATGRYMEFVPALAETVRKHFLPELRLHIIVFSDFRPYTSKLKDIQLVRRLTSPLLPWPLGTLLRYHFLAEHHTLLASLDYVFMCDADIVFVGDVGAEILGKRVATLGSQDQSKPSKFPYCRDPNSTACILPGQGSHYYVGGFQGGETASYLSDCMTIAEMINEDLKKGLIAEWHDESYWNAFLLQHPPTVELPTDYCTGEPERTESTKLMALVKNHKLYHQWTPE